MAGKRGKRDKPKSGQRPEHPWDWVLCPPLWPMALIYGVVRIYQHVKHKYQESRLRKRLARRGRFIDENALAVKLSAGEGTMIVQLHCGPLLVDAPRDFASIWWTSDDVLELAPVLLPPTERQAYEEPRTLYWKYVEEFVTRYVDQEHGVAKLTRFPKRIPDRFPTNSTGVVTLIEGKGTAVLIQGDPYGVLIFLRQQVAKA